MGSFQNQSGSTRGFNRKYNFQTDSAAKITCNEDSSAVTKSLLNGSCVTGEGQEGVGALLCGGSTATSWAPCSRFACLLVTGHKDSLLSGSMLPVSSVFWAPSNPFIGAKMPPIPDISSWRTAVMENGLHYLIRSSVSLSCVTSAELLNMSEQFSRLSSFRPFPEPVSILLFLLGPEMFRNADSPRLERGKSP